MNNKKAQSMSMNVIIIAVLSLIVLVVLLFIFGDKINVFGKGVSSCQGVCRQITSSNTAYSTCDNPENGKKLIYNPSGKCSQETSSQKYACCMIAPQEV